ncbi:LytTR family DNA-binding domain-containing protein [Cryomorphaceae bacterium 1068]|nr:LytTR family DNA-binding domain-containing protein [Cryomorphaceae bacterium 1068]
MLKMKVLLIDDERLARKELSSLLEKHDNIEIIGEAQNADEAKKLIEELNPDLIFLDIQMPGKTGFELLEELEATPEVIFVTAYDDYAIRAFEVNALDYLLKPVDELRLDHALLKVQERVDKTKEDDTESENDSPLTMEDQIFLKDGDKCWFVTLKDIKMFESEGNYVRVYFGNSKPLILKSLNNLEKRLIEKDFFRINRKFIVNLKEVIHIEPWFNGGLQIKLKTGEQLEVSRRQSAKFKDLLSL